MSNKRTPSKILARRKKGIEFSQLTNSLCVMLSNASEWKRKKKETTSYIDEKRIEKSNSGIEKENRVKRKRQRERGGEKGNTSGKPNSKSNRQCSDNNTSNSLFLLSYICKHKIYRHPFLLSRSAIRQFFFCIELFVSLSLCFFFFFCLLGLLILLYLNSSLVHLH